jgi:hypothetical protein
MAPQDWNSNGPLALFDEVQTEILLLWRDQDGEAAAAASSLQAAQRMQTGAAWLAAGKMDSLRGYINQYLISDHAAFEELLMRIFEMVYDIRSNMMYEIHIILKIDAESGWPTLKIRIQYPMSRRMIEQVTASTREFISKMAEAGAPELPQEVYIVWQLCDAGEMDELEYSWGKERWHFGRLDLGRCLHNFPDCSLDMGWF